MGFRRASLRVLAPAEFYGQHHHLDWLGTSLSRGIAQVAQQKTGGALSMNFAFSAFPAGFLITFESGEDVMRISSGEDPSALAVQKALCGRTPVSGGPTDR
jgi:hypothetical protein